MKFVQSVKLHHQIFASVAIFLIQASNFFTIDASIGTICGCMSVIS